jgi:hypothetical protein
MDAAAGVHSVIAQFIEDHKHLTKNAGGGNINTKALDQRQTLITQVDSILSSMRDSMEQLTNLSNAARQLQQEEIHTLDIILGNVKNGKPTGGMIMSRDQSTFRDQNFRDQGMSRDQSFRDNTQPNGGMLRDNTQHNSSVPSVVHLNSGTSSVVSAGSVVSNTMSSGSKIKPLSDPAWTLVQRKPRTLDVIKTERVPAPRTLPQVGGNYERIPITQSVVLNAIPVRNFADVKCDGCLYYVTTCSHFAIIINGMMFHGNIGIIYTDSEDPEKIKDCKFTEGCNRANMCRYYHDPIVFQGSSDRRNYIASSCIYTSPSAMYKNRSRSRRYGSLEHLDTDMLGLNDEEKNRMYDQVMHDLLCALVLKSIEPVKNK